MSAATQFHSIVTLLCQPWLPQAQSMLALMSWKLKWLKEGGGYSSNPITYQKKNFSWLEKGQRKPNGQWIKSRNKCLNISQGFFTVVASSILLAISSFSFNLKYFNMSQIQQTIFDFFFQFRIYIMQKDKHIVLDYFYSIQNSQHVVGLSNCI